MLRFDAKPDAVSVERHVRFEPAGAPAAIPVRVVAGAEREQTLKQALWDKPRDADVVIEPVLALPADSRVALAISPGITANGVASKNAQTFTYKTRAPLSLTVHCERTSSGAGCLPIASVSLRFSSPVAVSTMGRARLVPLETAQNGEKGSDPVPPLQLARSDASEKSAFDDSFVAKGPFVPKAHYRLELPAELRDDAGRALAEIDPQRLVLEFDDLPPLAKFAAPFGLVEAADPLLPVTLRRIEPEALSKGISIALGGETQSLHAPNARQIWRWLRVAGETHERTRSMSLLTARGDETLPAPKTFELPRSQRPDATEVVGIPLPGPGLHAVEIASRVLGGALLGEKQIYYARSVALVTNLSVHLKLGREGSLVWVTTLDRAKPVAGARIAVTDCEGRELAAATTDDDGIARVDGLPAGSELSERSECGWKRYERGLLVTAQLGADVSFVHTSWNEGIEPWRYDVPTSWREPGPIAHTILDRALFRAGETVHMKHLLRVPALSGIVNVAPTARPTEIRVVHTGSGDTFTLPADFAADGSATNEWEIPKQAKLGTYQVVLAGGGDDLYTGSFRVEQYRLPLLYGKLQGSKKPVLAGKPISLDVALSYLSGGPAAALPVELRSQLRPSSVGEVPGFEQHVFLRGNVRTGVERREGGWWREEEQRAAAAPAPAKQLTLDGAGGARTELGPVPESDVPQQVLAELSFRDPNGELQTLAQTIPVWPGERMIGLRVAKHATAEQPLRTDIALLDLERRPVAGGAVSVELFQRKVYSYRKRLVGGFYAYEHAVETQRIATLCEGKTNRAGTLSCSAKLPATGQLIVRATASDGAGRWIATYEEIWIPGPEEYWYEASDADRIDLIPESLRVEPGERARIQVRVPFRDATALVTVEREGVAEAFVTRLSGRDPVIKVPITAAHAPNVFVSVLAVRGRVAKPEATAFVDLARPASKLGVTELYVGLAPRTLDVSVKPERETYQVRERVRAKIRVRTATGKAPPPGTELAIAVVDEALLELEPNRSWDVLEAMHGRRDYGVSTYTAQQQVVGKRHFGLKARPAGGGGGLGSTRELFDTLLLWKPRVALDANGEAEIAFALNDALTRFRVAAIATSGVDRFGTGFASVRTTQDVMVLPGVAPVAREGDRVRPEFTVRNASDEPRAIDVSLAVAGLPEKLEPKRFELAPGEAQIAAWEVRIPVDLHSLEWTASATAPPEAGAAARVYDRVTVKQQVVPAVPETILQAELVQLGAAPFARVVERPHDAIPGRGGIDVLLRPSLAADAPGIDRYFALYPYDCLEQQTSTAIGTLDREKWRATMGVLPSHLDADGLAKFWPSPWLEGSDTLTAYLLAIAHEAGWEIPQASRERMLDGLEAFADGRITRWSWAPIADVQLRRIAALEALSRYGRVLPGHVASLPSDLSHLPTSALLDVWSLLGRVAELPAAAARRARVERLLRARLTVGGTTVGFSTERGDALDWMLATAEANLNRFLLLAHGTPFERDLPRLMRGALARQREGSWSTTVANAWGRLALRRFAERFEAQPVAGETLFALGSAEQRTQWDRGVTAGSDPAVTPKSRLPWPAARAELRGRHTGAGKPWAEIQSVAAVPLKQPLFAGYQIERSWTPVVQKTPGVWARGDVVRVHLTIDAQSDFSWVVVDDPIPAGATILGSGLGRDSQLLTQGESTAGDGWWCPCRAFTERTQLAYRDYFQYVPKGKLEIEYTLRLNQDGEFALPPTHVEAMYAPETFADLPHETLRVAK
ncbi:MAG TPA: MG2 domain-containing protein [Myxococcota bacterium]|nr:MG2 domain-containing protein [Myxococcota bacterium]